MSCCDILQNEIDNLQAQVNYNYDILLNTASTVDPIPATLVTMDGQIASNTSSSINNTLQINNLNTNLLNLTTVVNGIVSGSVTNPLTSNLDGGGFNISNVGTLSTNNLNVTNLTSDINLGGTQSILGCLQINSTNLGATKMVGPIDGNSQNLTGLGTLTTTNLNATNLLGNLNGGGFNLTNFNSVNTTFLGGTTLGGDIGGNGKNITGLFSLGVDYIGAHALSGGLNANTNNITGIGTLTATTISGVTNTTTVNANVTGGLTAANANITSFVADTNFGNLYRINGLLGANMTSGGTINFNGGGTLNQNSINTVPFGVGQSKINFLQGKINQFFYTNPGGTSPQALLFLNPVPQTSPFYSVGRLSYYYYDTIQNWWASIPEYGTWGTGIPASASAAPNWYLMIDNSNNLSIVLNDVSRFPTGTYGYSMYFGL